jgi:hypothetical protein
MVVIASAYRTEDPGFEYRQGVRILGLYLHTLQSFSQNLMCIVVVWIWEKSNAFFNNAFSYIQFIYMYYRKRISYQCHLRIHRWHGTLWRLDHFVINIFLSNAVRSISLHGIHTALWLPLQWAALGWARTGNLRNRWPLSHSRASSFQFIWRGFAVRAKVSFFMLCWPRTVHLWNGKKSINTTLMSRQVSEPLGGFTRQMIFVSYGTFQLCMPASNLVYHLPT